MYMTTVGKPKKERKSAIIFSREIFSFVKKLVTSCCDSIGASLLYRHSPLINTYITPHNDRRWCPGSWKLGWKFLRKSSQSDFILLFPSTGGNYLPEAQSGRAVISFWWVFCILFLSTYSSNLTALLAASTVSLPFTSLEEMTQQSAFKWGMVDGVALNTLFSVSRWKKEVEMTNKLFSFFLILACIIFLRHVVRTVGCSHVKISNVFSDYFLLADIVIENLQRRLGKSRPALAA